MLSLCGREAWQGLEGNASPFSHFASLCHTSSGAKDQCFTSASQHSSLTCFCLTVKGAGSRSICPQGAHPTGMHAVGRALGWGDGGCWDLTVTLPPLKKEPQTYQQGMQDGVSVTLSLGKMCSGPWAGMDPSLGIQGKVGECSQLGRSIQKGFL